MFLVSSSPPLFLLLLSFILPVPLCFPLPSNPLLLPSPPGYQNIDLELKTPTDLNYEPPSPLRSDDFFSDGDSSADTFSKTTLTRPSDLSITQTASKDLLTVASGAPGAPIIRAEDTALSTEEREAPDNDRRAVEKFRKGPDECAEEESREGGTPDSHHGNGLQQGEEEEEEMTQERLRSLLEDIKLEGGLEDVEMTEEGVKAILEQVRQAEKDVCSVPGWRSETSSAVQATGPSQPPAEEGR